MDATFTFNSSTTLRTKFIAAFVDRITKKLSEAGFFGLDIRIGSHRDKRGLWQ